MLTRAQIHELGMALDAIHKRFSPAYGPGAGNNGWYAMEVEFKFDDEGRPTAPCRSGSSRRARTPAADNEPATHGASKQCGRGGYLVLVPPCTGPPPLVGRRSSGSQFCGKPGPGRAAIKM